MPKAITFDDAKPRRGHALVAFDAPAERNILVRMLLHSPKDVMAGAVAFAAVGAIVGNAMLMQTGRHPSPIFGSSVVVTLGAPFVGPLPKPRPLDASARPADSKSLDARLLDSKPVDGKSIDPVKPVTQPAGTTASVARAPAAARSSDPLGDLIMSSRRVASVQRALTEYGYGQLKPTGTIGSETQAAIQRFERDRKLPVTGQMSDRLVRELGAVTGRPLD